MIESIEQYNNKHPPAEPVVFHFRAVSPNTTSGAQAALMTTWQSCDCYLPPVNGHSLCLTFFSYAFAPSFFVPYFYFSVYFSILAFSSLFALFLIAFPFALFCSSAKPLLNPRTIAGFSLYKKAPGKSRELPKYPLSPRNFRTAAGITFSRKEQTEIVGRHGAPAVAQAARPAEGGRASAFLFRSS